MSRTPPRAESDNALGIGARLRRVRAARGMTIAQLAAATGLTKGFLSLVERDRANTSVANLMRICAALEMPVGALFEPAPTAFVTKATRARINFGGDRVEEFLLTPRSESRVQVIESHVQPGGGSGPEDYSLESETEVVHVIAGELEISVSGVERRMKAGDSLTFSPAEPHSWRNPSTRRVAHVLWIVAPAPR